MSILHFQRAKHSARKLTMTTCYDYAFARIVDQSDVDAILVGDSVAMVVHGHTNTTMATMPMMISHTQAVARGTSKFIVADLPFLSYRYDLTTTMQAVSDLIQAGAHAVKLEGAADVDTIRHIVSSGVPVMGHLGLTPQSVHAIGGHRVQGKQAEQAQHLLQQAQALEQAGCFAIVLECVPAALAASITQQCSIPIIGIGAGPQTDGQILVLHDLLGFDPTFTPTFLHHFADSHRVIQQGIHDYVTAVKQQQFPDQQTQSYHA